MYIYNIRINRLTVAIITFLFICFVVYFLKWQEEERPALVYEMLRNQHEVNLRKLLIGSIQAAEQGGLEILQVAHSHRLNAKSKGKTREGANDPFTDADGRSHCAMKQGLRRIFPHLTIVSEEDKQKCLVGNLFDLDPTVLHEINAIPDVYINLKDITVWLDPLDATQEFIEQLYDYVTTMVCVAVRGQPVIGVIHRPFIGETAWAWVDGPISEYLSNIFHKDANMANAIVTVSRSHPGDVRNLTKSTFGNNTQTLKAAGAGYKVLQVVANNATVYLHSTNIKKWDICAGDAILRALGGKMTTLENNFINYSAEGSPINDRGLLASITNHEQYIKKLMAYKEKQQS